MRHWLNLKPWPLAFWDEVQSIPNMRGAALQPPVFCLLAMFPFLSTVPSPVNSSLPSSDSWSLSSSLLTSCSTNKFFLTWEKSLNLEVTQEHEIKSRVWKNGNLPCCRSVYHLILSTKGIISRHFESWGSKKLNLHIMPSPKLATLFPFISHFRISHKRFLPNL